MDAPLSINLQAIIDDPQAWELFRDGVEVHWFYQTNEDGPASALLKYAPGAVVPLHEHAGYEHILVLHGAQQDEHGAHNKGELTVNPPGSSHSVSSSGGCIVYAVWERPPVFKT